MIRFRKELDGHQAGGVRGLARAVLSAAAAVAARAAGQEIGRRDFTAAVRSLKEIRSSSDSNGARMGGSVNGEMSRRSRGAHEMDSNSNVGAGAGAGAGEAGAKIAPSPGDPQSKIMGQKAQTDRRRFG